MQIDQVVTSVEIVSTFAERCHTIGRKLNLVCEEYYNEALEIAAKRDKETSNAIRERKTATLGLLHGIPVSIKDNVILRS